LCTYPDEAVVEDEADERGAVLAVGLDGLGHVVLDHVLHATALVAVVAHLEVASLRRRRLHRQRRRRCAQRRHQRHRHLHLLLASPSLACFNFCSYPLASCWLVDERAVCSGSAMASASSSRLVWRCAWCVPGRGRGVYIYGRRN
jgi:hypothetical protein